MRIDNSEIIKIIGRQMRNLGIFPGDVLFVKFDLGSFGLVKGFKRRDYLDLILDYLGAQGTLVSFAFTDQKLSILNRGLPRFDPGGPANTGAFSNIMLKYPDNRRSTHPTNSIVAIGAKAKEIVDSHTPDSPAFGFFKKIIDLDGKLLLVGSKEYPGFLTHYVEHELGYHKRFWYRFFIKTRLPDGTLYHKLDPGGCSISSDRLYPFYIREEALLAGYLNSGYSLSIRAKDAYEIDKKTLRDFPNLMYCDNRDCISCRAGRWSRLWNLPYYVAKRLTKKYYRKMFS